MDDPDGTRNQQYSGNIRQREMGVKQVCGSRSAGVGRRGSVGVTVGRSGGSRQERLLPVGEGGAVVKKGANSVGSGMGAKFPQEEEIQCILLPPGLFHSDERAGRCAQGSGIQ